MALDETRLAHYGLCEFCKQHNRKKLGLSFSSGRMIEGNFILSDDYVDKALCSLIADGTSMHAKDEKFINKWKSMCPYFSEHIMIDIGAENESNGDGSEWEI